MIGPMPGMVITRRQVSSFLADASISSATVSITIIKPVPVGCEVLNDAQCAAKEHRFAELLDLPHIVTKRGKCPCNIMRRLRSHETRGCFRSLDVIRPREPSLQNDRTTRMAANHVELYSSISMRMVVTA
jgi:hypothetical protein